MAKKDETEMVEEQEEQATETEAEETQETEAATETEETQDDDVDAMKVALKKANREAAKYRKEAEAAREAEEQRKKDEMSEAERLQAERDKAVEENKQLRKTFVQRDIAEELGLPHELAERIQGETPEEMREDAESLLKVVPKKQAPKVKSTSPTTKPDGKMTDEERRRYLWG